MKRRLLIISALATLFLLMCVSCKSTPPAPDSAKADEARKKAVDFEAPAYFPSEWEEAEGHYNAESFEAAEAAYDDLFKKAVPLYAQAREDEICAIREEIKQSGFADAFPDYLRAADEMALAAKAQYEAQDYYKAKETAAAAMGEYSTLLVGAKAYQARREIIDRGFLQYDQDNFERADEAGMLAVSKYEEGDKTGAVETAEEALLRYNLILINGWISYAADRRASAARERELALEEKANIASRGIFREADSILDQAEDAYSREDFRSAGVLYVDAEARFSVARQDTEEKRVKAEDAIRQAEEKIEESSEAASEAERVIEGGVR